VCNCVCDERRCVGVLSGTPDPERQTYILNNLPSPAKGHRPLQRTDWCARMPARRTAEEPTHSCSEFTCTPVGEILLAVRIGPSERLPLHKFA
jgi:hypothetical protein